MCKRPVLNMEATGKTIKELRKEAGITIQYVQQRMDLATPQCVYKWEKGLAMPRITRLVVLSELFGVPVDALLVSEECSQELHISDRVAGKIRKGSRTFRKEVIGGGNDASSYEMNDIGAYIRKLRLHYHLTVTELQEILDLQTPQAIYHWENGSTAPALDNILVIAVVFNVRVHDILIR